MNGLRDPQPNSNREPHNDGANRDLHPELGARIQPPQRVPTVRPSLLRQLRLLERLLARPDGALLIGTSGGLLLGERETAGAELAVAGAGLGLA
ncbi:hypothetical protein V495_04517 [Pseudogymnoascus sp. VKM F-4514 (FW-929)]|nr:hypothetical protein V495_04517 [Pseudogymnoascus sp. VKM F-4514 (FW-929)]